VAENRPLQRILVPLDGSELSERALAPAAILAETHNAEVTLARVIEPVPWSGAGYDWTVNPELYQTLYDQLEQQAQSSLDHLAGRLSERGTAVRTLLRNGIPAAELLEIEAETQPDLVVMASHGRSGLQRFALGSVADRLVREGIAPVMLVRSFTLTTTRLEAALVGLDGSETAEAVLPFVERLAGKPLRSVRLVRAVATADELPEATRYLQGVTRRLEQAGLQSSFEAPVGAPAELILDASTGLDLVMLATHGRGGIDRFRHGSVAERAMRELPVPVLLVRARAPTPKPERVPAVAQSFATVVPVGL